jgi:hypothetical protein
MCWSLPWYYRHLVCVFFGFSFFPFCNVTSLGNQLVTSLLLKLETGEKTAISLKTLSRYDRIFYYFQIKFLKWRKKRKTPWKYHSSWFFHFSGKQVPIARIVAKICHQKQNTLVQLGIIPLRPSSSYCFYQCWAVLTMLWKPPVPVLTAILKNHLGSHY